MKYRLARNVTFEEQLGPHFCPIWIRNGQKLISFNNFTLVSQSLSHKIGNNIISVFLE